MIEEPIARHTRGPNKDKAWTRPLGLGAVLRLALDVRDPLHRRHLESMFSAAFSLRRALQGGARRRAAAFRSAKHERKRRGPEAVRKRVGLSREAFERAAYAYLDRAPHLRRFVTKALAMHLADAVWTPVERHLFPGTSGKRTGLPHVGRWFDFARLPGRARSHTKPRKWETFRLHGTLAGHRDAYATARGGFRQPRSLRAVERPNDSWWSHSGPLVVVFSGLGCGELVLPVRLPTAPSNQAALDHYLSNPETWHKVDIVRRRDPNASGGWRYEAHLMVLTEPYASPATKARRDLAARESAARMAGIDVNVSNVTLASHAGGSDLRVTRLERDAGEREAARRSAKKERHRARALERSRRAANPDQYTLSPKQEAEARTRDARGLPARKVIPRGSRKSSADGRPLRSFRKDSLSKRYRQERAAQAAAASSAARARKEVARALAGRLTLEHGFRAVIEDCNLTAWARRWGRALHAFSPGTLIAALERETRAIARQTASSGGLFRATTVLALSQRCLCGARVEKSLAERVHRCSSCPLVADRDAMSAVLASVVRFADERNPSTASIHVDLATALASRPSTRQTLELTLHRSAHGRQDARSESTASSAHTGSSRMETERTSSVAPGMARRIVGVAPRTTPNETGTNRTTSERARLQADLPNGGTKLLPPVRDSS